MGRRGFQPAPTALKLVAGTRKARVNNNEPQPTEGNPICPSKDPEVQAVWDYTLDELKVMRIVTLADRDSLHAYCEAVIMHRRASEQLAREGLIGRNFMKHPAVSIQKEAANSIRQFAREFGLSPGARSGISLGNNGQQKPRDQGAGRLLSG